MRSRILRLILLAAVLGICVGQVMAQDSVVQAPATESSGVLLEYKFVPNDLLRYKMNMDMAISMGGAMGAAGQMNANMSMVMRQRIKKVLENGDADITGAVESMSMDMMGQSQKMDVSKFPTFSFVMSKSGAMKQIQGMDKITANMGNMFFADPMSFTRYNMLPTKPVAPGATWEEDMPVPTGGSIHIKSTLLRLEGTPGNCNTAIIKQDMSGTIDLSSMLGAAAGGQAGANAPTGTANIAGDMTMCFSPQQGKMTKTDGIAKIKVSMVVTPPEGQGSSQTIDMNMDVRLTMSLLPPDKSKK